MQEAAYASLLKSRRQQLHARVAQVLEEQFPDIAAARPELLAHHCTEAGFVEKAVEYWWRAGQAALAQSAPAEAVGHLRKALDIFGLLPDTVLRAELELEIRTALGSALMAGTSGYARLRAGEILRPRARAVRTARQGREALSPLVWEVGVSPHARRDAGRTRVCGGSAPLGRGPIRKGGLTVAHRLVGVSCALVGQAGGGPLASGGGPRGP